MSTVNKALLQKLADAGDADAVKALADLSAAEALAARKANILAVAAQGPDAVMDAADAGTLPLDQWQRRFRQRNGALPHRHGWLLFMDESTGAVMSADPRHECHTPHGLAAILAGRNDSVQPDNGR